MNNEAAAVTKEVGSVSSRKLFEDLYYTLHARAKNLLRAKHRLDPTGPTSLLHDAFIRLERTESLSIVDQEHFVALASQTMRRIIIDRAKRIRSLKNGSGAQPVELTDDHIPFTRDPDELIAIDAALEQIALKSPRAAQVCELLVFVGLGVKEIAALLNLHRKTIHRDIEFLSEELKSLGYGSDTISK